jgi:hypothetical protein
MAQGTAAAAWARAQDPPIPRRTAYRWAKDPRVKAAVESYRRRAVDRAIGRMAKRVTWAADGIVKLAKGAASEAVRLAALRAVISDLMAVSNFAGLERRMARIEEQLREQTGSPDRPR